MHRVRPPEREGDIAAMAQEHLEQFPLVEPENGCQRRSLDEVLPRIRATLALTPEIRLAYYQPGPSGDHLCLSGPDCARVVVAFSRKVSDEDIGQRLIKLNGLFAPLLCDTVEFRDIESFDYREACELSFNAQVIYGSVETVERDRLFRYNQFLEWNAGRRSAGEKQESPPALMPAFDRTPRVVSVQQFITPIYRHLKMMEGYLRELRRFSTMDYREFAAESTARPLAESYILKGMQSAILITMSVMHRKMRLSARDYRDLFLLMPVFGFITRDRSNKLAKCAEFRDRLMFQYEVVTVEEIYQQTVVVLDTLTDFKSYRLEWLFEQYYGPSGELIQHE